MSTIKTNNIQHVDATSANIALDSSGNATVNGTLTATSFSGDGSALTGLASDAISEGNTSVEVVDTGSNGEVRFTTEGTRAMTISSSQRVGIGTAAPNATLEVAGTTRHSTKNSNAIEFWYGTSYVANDYYSLAWRSQYSTAAEIRGLLTVGSGTGQTGALAFYTNNDSSNSERMRLDPNGRLLVGTSSSVRSDALLQIYKASGNNELWLRSNSLNNNETAGIYATAANGVAGIGTYKHSGITNACGFLNLRTEAVSDAYLWLDNSFNLRVSTTATYIGTVAGTVVGTQTSDERLKNILGPVEYSLDTIKQIEPVRYSLKSEPETEKLGFIAQQVLPLVPESVFDTKEHIEGEPEDAPTKLGMEYVALIPVLVNAIKELSAEVDALKATINP